MSTELYDAIVWSQPNCQYCDLAKKLLTMRGLEYQERIIGMDEGNWPKEALMKAVPNARSVPQVFVKGKYVGGYKELREYLNDNFKDA